MIFENRIFEKLVKILDLKMKPLDVLRRKMAISGNLVFGQIGQNFGFLDFSNLAILDLFEIS